MGSLILYVFIHLKIHTFGTKKREVIRGCTRKCCAGAYLSKHRKIRGDRYVISYKTMPFSVGNVFIYAFLFVLVYKINVQLYYTQLKSPISDKDKATMLIGS